jgi:hypothetical protein
MPDEVPVLIVGGSLVGLSAAMFLGVQGIPAVVVERHRGTAIHPRAGHFHLRTLELMRSAGIEAKVRAASEKQFDLCGGINAVGSLAGKEIAKYIPNLDIGVEEFSPSYRLFMTQQELEPILRARAEDEAWVEGAQQAARKLKVLALDAYRIDRAGELADEKGRFSEAYGSSPTGAVIVRLDGFAAWRAKTTNDNRAQTVERVLSSLSRAL